MSYYAVSILPDAKGEEFNAIEDFSKAIRLDANSEANPEIRRFSSEIFDKIRKRGPAPRLISVTIDPKLSSSVSKISPPITVAEDTEQLFEETERVDHSVSITDGWNVGGEVK